MTPYGAALALFVLLLLPALAGAAPEGKIVISTRNGTRRRPPTTCS